MRGTTCGKKFQNIRGASSCRQILDSVVIWRPLQSHRPAEIVKRRDPIQLSIAFDERRPVAVRGAVGCHDIVGDFCAILAVGIKPREFDRSPIARLFLDAVVGDGLADEGVGVRHGAAMLGRHLRQVNDRGGMRI